MRQPARGRGSCAGQGFSLIEVLVTMVLVLLLAGAMIFTFSGLGGAAALEEGASRLESLILFGRAHAANSGRRVQLSFEMAPEAADMPTWVGIVKLLWEPDPLGQPGVFQVLPEAQAHAAAVNELIFIEDVGAPGASSGGSTNETSELADTPVGFDEAMQDFFMPINFNPDGSSDSAEIKLLSRDPEETRRMTLRLEGVTGTMRRVLITPESEGSDFLEDPDLFLPAETQPSGQSVTRP
jgi:prepilin-type N-terminal cleavage/methylation domain-containing protein